MSATQKTHEFRHGNKTLESPVPTIASALFFDYVAKLVGVA
jgi:hypothetical protein